MTRLIWTFDPTADYLIVCVAVVGVMFQLAHMATLRHHRRAEHRIRDRA